MLHKFLLSQLQKQLSSYTGPGQEESLVITAAEISKKDIVLIASCVKQRYEVHRDLYEGYLEGVRQFMQIAYPTKQFRSLFSDMDQKIADSASVSPPSFSGEDIPKKEKTSVDWEKQKETSSSRPPTQSTVLKRRLANEVIAVMSGKGGVGKSTTARALARFYVTQGKKVALLDADVYGPSQPILERDVHQLEEAMPLGDSGVLSSQDLTLYQDDFGVYSYSLGSFVGRDQALIWRGPMAGAAIKQALSLDWPEQLDYFIIDYPPGTGDVQITLAQQLEIDKALLVTAPGLLPLSDLRRAWKFCEKTQLKPWALVLNMAQLECPHCHTPINLDDRQRIYDFALEHQLRVLPEIEVQAITNQSLKAAKIQKVFNQSFSALPEL